MKYKQIFNKINNLLFGKKANKRKISAYKPEIIEQKLNRNQFGYPIYIDKNDRNLKQ